MGPEKQGKVVPAETRAEAARRKAAPGPALSWGPPAFVWLVWTLALVAAVTFVWKLGSAVPFREDWYWLVATLTGDQPVTWEWLWELSGEHREPLYKGLQITLLKIGGGDFRAPLLFSALALGTLAGVLIWTAKKVRGWTDYADACLPLALLQLHYHMLYAAGAIAVLSPTLVGGTLLALMARYGTRPPPAARVGAGLCLALLPLCGPYGLSLFPAALLWFGLGEWNGWRAAAGRRWWHALSLALAALALLTIYFYFRGYQRSQYFAPSPGIGATLGLAWTYATSSLGLATEPLWPYSGWLMMLLLVLSVAGLLWTIWRQPGPGRSRAIALLAFSAAETTLGLAIGWGRSGGGENLGWYYYVLPVPLLCGLYFVWVIARPRSLSLFAQTSLLSLLCAAAALNAERALREGKAQHAGLAAFEEDLRRGEPPYVLLARHKEALSPWLGSVDMLAEGFERLHRAGIGAFRTMAPDPPMRFVSLPVAPTAMEQVEWSGGVARGSSPAAYLSFSLPQPMYVAGLQIHCSYAETASSWLTVSWIGKGTGSSPQEHQIKVGPGVPNLTTAFMADTIDGFRLYPNGMWADRPFEFTITELVLLIPQTEPVGAGQ